MFFYLYSYTFKCISEMYDLSHEEGISKYMCSYLYYSGHTFGKCHETILGIIQHQTLRLQQEKQP